MLETTRLLRDLVGLPSVNPMGRSLSGPDVYEHRVTDYLEDFFRTLGVPWERQPVAPSATTSWPATRFPALGGP